MKGKFSKAEILDTFYFADIAHNKTADELTRIFGDSLTIIDPFIKGIGDSCLIIKDGENAIVAFPGSKDFVDWVLNFYKYYDPRDGMHPGILKQLDDMAEYILSVLMSLQPKKIILTGVSRGGGLAEAFLEIYSHLLDTPIDCITFAQPRVFTHEYYDKNFSLKEAESVRYLRVKMANDIVTKLPQSKYGYTHKGDVLELGKKLSPWQLIKRMWKAWRDFDKFIVAGISEHDTDVYRNHLKVMKR